MQDLSRAFWRFIINPRRFGAIAPSSRALAALMTRSIGPANRPIIELGPGTGVFTKALRERGVPEKDLILVESDPYLADIISQRFPLATVICRDAETLIHQGLALEHKAAVAISGLPLRNFAKTKVASILEGVFDVMAKNGELYQFTYATRCPADDDVLFRLDLEATCVGRIWFNLPPATVYRIRKRQLKTAPAA